MGTGKLTEHISSRTRPRRGQQRSQRRVGRRLIHEMLEARVVLSATYLVADLGGLPESDSSAAVDINNSGEVVGNSIRTGLVPQSRAVKWDANASINPYNPFLAMWSAITRTTERNSVIVPSEAITREEALRMYTINNAYASFEESIKGSIEPGKLADVAILSDDFMDCPVDKIKDIKADLTIVGGKVVYSSREN